MMKFGPAVPGGVFLLPLETQKTLIMENSFWIWFVKAGKWSVNHYRAFFVGAVVFAALYSLISKCLFEIRCRQGTQASLNLWFFDKEDCNACAASSTFSIHNSGPVGFLNNGTGSLNVYNPVKVNPGPNNLHDISQETLDKILENFPPNEIIPILLHNQPDTIKLAHEIHLRDELRLKLCESGRKTDWTPTVDLKVHPKKFLFLEGNEITLYNDPQFIDRPDKN